MRVLLINTSERTGGAAIACNRLMEALKKQGVRAKMLVRDKQTDRLTVIAVKATLLMPLKFLWERLLIFISNKFRRNGIFLVDIANTGADVTSMREFQSADVIHLHWVNQGFLSLKDIEKILNSGKPVVVTMHDMWYFTGICHYSSGCEKYKTGCNRCEQLNGGRSLKDWSKQVFDTKLRIYSHARIVFVGCSRWMADLARESVLARGHKICNIPNPIDMQVFCRMDKAEVRRKYGFEPDRKILLFGAQRITDERKGFEYLIEACKQIKEKNPELASQVDVLVVGGDAAKIRNRIPFEVRTVDYVKEQQHMVELYNLATVFVTPSLQDNLPNTIVEAMACGVPCVGFKVGGIPEMIDHMQDGYVAEFKNPSDLAIGIEWVLTAGYEQLSAAAYAKAADTYSEKTVARKYMELYDNACNSNI